MSDVYDRELTAALIDEARKLAAALKIEAGEIKTVIDKAFDGNDGDDADAIGSRRQLVKIIARFVVVRQVKIVTRLVPEHGLRSGHRLSRKDHWNE